MRHVWAMLPMMLLAGNAVASTASDYANDKAQLERHRADIAQAAQSLLPEQLPQDRSKRDALKRYYPGVDGPMAALGEASRQTANQQAASQAVIKNHRDHHSDPDHYPKIDPTGALYNDSNTIIDHSHAITHGESDDKVNCHSQTTCRWEQETRQCHIQAPVTVDCTQQAQASIETIHIAEKRIPFQGRRTNEPRTEYDVWANIPMPASGILTDFTFDATGTAAGWHGRLPLWIGHYVFHFAPVFSTLDTWIAQRTPVFHQTFHNLHAAVRQGQILRFNATGKDYAVVPFFTFDYSGVIIIPAHDERVGKVVWQDEHCLAQGASG